MAPNSISISETRYVNAGKTIQKMSSGSSQQNLNIDVHGDWWTVATAIVSFGSDSHGPLFISELNVNLGSSLLPCQGLNLLQI